MLNQLIVLATAFYVHALGMVMYHPQENADSCETLVSKYMHNHV